MKPTTEHIITALREGIAFRTDLCERLGCENADLTKVIRNMLDRDLITRELEDGALAYYLTAKGREWRPGMQSASVRAKAREAKGGDSEGGEPDAAPDFATAPELQYLAPEDYEMPPPNAKLLASANRELSEQLQNATALADKLQALLTSKEHECESLRAQMAHACNGGCKPDMDAVPLADLIQQIAMFIDDGISLTIYGSDTASVQAFGKSFVCSYDEANRVLDASAMLARLEDA